MVSNENSNRVRKDRFCFPLCTTRWVLNTPSIPVSDNMLWYSAWLRAHDIIPEPAAPEPARHSEDDDIKPIVHRRPKPEKIAPGMRKRVHTTEAQVSDSDDSDVVVLNDPPSVSFKEIFTYFARYLNINHHEKSNKRPRTENISAKAKSAPAPAPLPNDDDVIDLASDDD
jgi:hypothetical protein